MAMSHKRPTVKDLLDDKGKVQKSNVYVDSVDECAAAEATGIDIITVRDSRMDQAYRWPSMRTSRTSAG